MRFSHSKDSTKFYKISLLITVLCTVCIVELIDITRYQAIEPKRSVIGGLFAANVLAGAKKEKTYVKHFLQTMFYDPIRPVSRFSATLERLGMVDENFYIYDEQQHKYVKRYITSWDRQIALVKNLFIVGAFKRSIIKDAIFGLGGTFGPNKKIPEEVMPTVDKIMQSCGAYQSNPKLFNATAILNELFHSRQFDDQDVEDIFFYIAQLISQMNNNSSNGMLKKDIYLNQQKQRYFIQNASIIGLIGPIYPEEDTNELWIVGSDRPTCINRLSFLQSIYSTEDLKKSFNKIVFVTGWRSLSAEVDGLGETKSLAKEEGLNYIAHIARTNAISPKQGSFFIENRQSYSTPHMQFNDYGETRETLMLKDIYNRVFRDDSYTVIDAKTEKDDESIRDVAYMEAILNAVTGNTESNNITITVLSSQPYALKQVKQIGVIAKQLSLEKDFDIKTRIIPIGASITGDNSSPYINYSDQMITNIHLETMALISEGYKNIVMSSNTTQRKRSIVDLQNNLKISPIKQE